MLRFSTETYPEHERVAIWREVFGRQVFRIDLELPPDAQFLGDVALHSAPGLNALFGVIGVGVRGTRTPELITDGLNDLMLTINRTGRTVVSQRGTEHYLEASDAALSTLAEAGSNCRATAGEALNLQIPRSAIAPLYPNLGDAIMRPIRRDSPALQLLIRYMDVVRRTDALADRRLAAATVSHVHDLVGLIIAPTRDTLEMTRGRGLRAAQLATIKADIIANIAHGDLSVATIAQRHGVSPRYIHRLFEHNDCSFGAFVLEQKLGRAHRMLTDSRFAGWTIGAIAEQAGFAERSHFNRAVRQRFGASPSDLRSGGNDPEGVSQSDATHPSRPNGGKI